MVRAAMVFDTLLATVQFFSHTLFLLVTIKGGGGREGKCWQWGGGGERKRW